MAYMLRVKYRICKSLNTVPQIYQASSCGCNMFLSKECNQPIYLKQKRFSSYYTFPLFTGTQYILENFHHYSMMPWWGTIMCTTIILRTIVTLPLAIKQNRSLAKMELLQPQLKEITEAVKYNTIVRGQRDGKEKAEIQREVTKQLKLYTKDFQKRNGVTPAKLLMLPWLQLPLWITVSFALRNICGYIPKDSNSEGDFIYLPAHGIETEGLLWFSNLTVPDPLYILPMVLLFTNLLNIELSSMRQQTPSTFSKILTRVFRGITVMIFFVSTQVPSAMSLYWAISSSYGLAQNVILKYPKVRRRLQIPKTLSEHEKPLTFILDVIKSRSKKFLEIQRAGEKK